MRLKFPLSVTVVLSFFVPLSASAYPIFYKCDSKRQMTEVLTGDEIYKKLQPLMSQSAVEQTNLIESYCDGSQECEKQLSQIVKLAKISKEIAEKTLSDELNALDAQAPSQPIHEVDSKTFKLKKQIEAGAFNVAACRNTISKLPVEKFLSPHGVVMFYPHYTEYTYVTGCRNYGEGRGWMCSEYANDAGSIQDAIKKALSMGVDPYTFLAIGLMENGAAGWHYLYLDPIGKMGVIGCTETQIDGSKPGEKILKSFGTNHKIEPGIVQNPRLSDDLKRYLTSQEEVDPGTSYFCRDLGTADAQIVNKADPSECCLKLGFTPKGSSVDAIEKALIVKFVGRSQFKQMAGKTDPAFRIQGFNGFSRLMGGAEGVSAFRSGIDNYETPTYGYQGMDFILNSLVSNPWIKQEVERQSKEMGMSSPSILCMDVATPGTYQIDSDYYFKKYRDTPRMKALIGRSWASMHTPEKRVLSEELWEPIVRAQIIKKFGGMPKEMQDRFKISNPPPTAKVTMDQIVSYYFKEIYATRSTVSKASDLPWGDLPDEALQKIISEMNP